MELAYSVTGKDLRAFFVFHARHDQRRQRVFAFTWWWILALLAALTVLTVLANHGLVFVGFWSGLALVWLVFGRQSLTAFDSWYLRRSLRDADLSVYLGDQRVLIEDSGLNLTSATSDTRLSWSAIRRISDGGAHTFIYVSDISAIVVPHNSVTAGNLDTFLQLVRSRIASERPGT